jgi:hypothetical protein
LVRPKISEEVEAGVKESKESEHAAKADELGELKDFAEGRDAEGDDK